MTTPQWQLCIEGHPNGLVELDDTFTHAKRPLTIQWLRRKGTLTKACSWCTWHYPLAQGSWSPIGDPSLAHFKFWQDSASVVL
jgi:hypothetical protein